MTVERVCAGEKSVGFIHLRDAASSSLCLWVKDERCPATPSLKARLLSPGLLTWLCRTSNGVNMVKKDAFRNSEGLTAKVDSATPAMAREAAS